MSGFARALRTTIRALVATVTLVGTVGAWWLARPDQMVVEHVMFDGLERAHPAALRHLSDIRNGATVWSVDLSAVEDGVERHPWVREATANLEWRSATVHVEVTEYEPTALLLRGGALFYVAHDGVVFARSRSDDLDYPVLTGVEADLDSAHPDLPRLVVRDALWLVRSLDERGLVANGDVSEVAFRRTRGFTVHTGHAQLVFGLEDLPKQVDRLSVLLGEGLDLSEPVLVDLAPARVAIVRPIQVTAGEG